MHYQFGAGYPAAPHGKTGEELFLATARRLDLFGSYAQFRNPMMMMYPGGYPVSSSPTSLMDPMASGAHHHHHHHQQQESSAVTSGAA